MRLLLALHSDNSGTLRPENGADAWPVESAEWLPSFGELRVRTREAGAEVWHRLLVTDGVAAGRFARREVSPGGEPPGLESYTARLVGWRRETFDAEITPRVWRLVFDGAHATLRLDRGAAPGTFIGHLKVEGFADGRPHGERIAVDVEVKTWDGTRLELVLRRDGHEERLWGEVRGRALVGEHEGPKGERRAFSGERAEILFHGLAPIPARELGTWQERTRRRIARLTMAGNPAPLRTEVKVQDVREPQRQWGDAAHRDDDPGSWPQDYDLTELSFEHTVPDPWGGPPLVRRAHGFLARPRGAPVPGGRPAVVALNGHNASAWRVFDPDGPFWYGDGLARRGLVVLAIDVSHRPLAERGSLYADYLDGDDPHAGNGPHPAIAQPGLDSDFSEDGERVWDVLRAVDYVRSLPEVDPSFVAVTGLSLGAAVAQMAGALDLRVKSVVAAGETPDFGVLAAIPAHACWRWHAGDVREFVDFSDFLALTAPRPLVVQSGRADYTSSFADPPFAADKEVVRRALPAFAETPGALVHHLHDAGHALLFAPAGFDVPRLQGPAPDDPWSVAWAADGEAVRIGRSLLDVFGAPVSRPAGDS